MGASIKPDRIREKAGELKDSHRLMAISAIDEEGGITLCYHFWRLEDREVLNLKVKVGKEEIRTISDIIPNSLNYEREIHDLMGVEFKGAKLEPLLIPKGYKKYPLRKALETVQSARTGSSNPKRK
jgi:membrane-bound hydrogenase subunit beta